MKLNRKHLAALAAGGLAVGAIGGSSLVGAGGEPRPAFGPMPSDVDGDGVISDRGAERAPALVRAVGDDGTLGYVKLEDMLGNMPTSPAAALAAQARSAGQLKLYDETGNTEVSVMTARPSR